MKDFMAKHAWVEVEFYMGMVVEEDQSFKGLIEHLCDTFQSRKTLCELITDFFGQFQKPERLRTLLLMTCRCWPENHCA